MIVFNLHTTDWRFKMAEYFTSCVMLELQYSSAEILTACPSSADDTTQLIRKMLEPIEWLEQQQ